MNSVSVDDLNVIEAETLIKLEELKESVPAPAIENIAGRRLATKKSLTRRIPDFFSLSYMPQALFVIYIRAICCFTCRMLYHMCFII